MTGRNGHPLTSSREVAVQTLDAFRCRGAWSDGYLKRMLRENRLDRREAALATRLCYGVLQNQMLLDWHLRRFSKLPLEKLEGKVLCILRVAVYQMLFMDRIPSSAAVNEAVNQARVHSRNPKTAGMVNGILRSMLRQMPLPQPEERDEIDTLAVRTSHPRWLVEQFSNRLGLEEAGALLAANNLDAPITAQVNLCRVSVQELQKRLGEEGATARPHPWMSGCLTLDHTGNLESLSTFQDGLFYVQDCAARLAVSAAGLKPGDRVLDCCAAPGGKTFAAAVDLEDRGLVICCDIHPHKVKLIEAGKSRLKLDSPHPMLQDASQLRPEWAEQFDAVIADVPCSGLGIIRKKPDIRYKDPESLAGLPAIQGRILDCNAAYVRKGGVLIYSTCTLLQRENEDVVSGFLTAHPDFSLEVFELPYWGRQEGMITLWPHIHGTDGFFIAKLRREG